MSGFFIHIVDPGFPDEPWPGERRFGPYPTPEEAREQAASDLAGGSVSRENFLGILSRDDSNVRMAHTATALSAAPDVYDPRTVEGPFVDHAFVLERADALQLERAKRAADAASDHRAALARMLPEGVDVDEFMSWSRS